MRRFSTLIGMALAALSFSSTTIAQLSDPATEWREKAQNADLLLLKFAEFDPVLGLPPMLDVLRPDRGRDLIADQQFDYAIVQFSAPPSALDRDLLNAVGLTILEYVPNNAYLVHGTITALSTASMLPGVRAQVPFAPAFRISPDALDAPIQRNQIYDISVFPGEDMDAVIAKVLSANATLLPQDGEENRLRVQCTPDRLDDLAHIEGISWIQEEPLAILRNDRTAWVIQSNETNNPTLWNKGLLGQGQVVGHIDDALDLGNCYFNDPNQPNAGPLHRKVIFHRGSTSQSGDHGVHTAGTAAGDRELIDGSTFRNGLAYRSKIAHANLSSVSGSNLNSRLQELYDNGARVLTNSWGNDGTTSYDNWARDIDLFSWNNEDALAMWAATNTSTLKNPENAKNCLAVGASSQTPSENNHCSGGRGPTSDGRRKPEIYAPGCGIRSANAGTSCGTQSLSGTSMASPSICGAGALVRQYFVDGFYPSGAANPGDAFVPTGALIKAVLVNGSVDMSGVGGFPSNTEGWGRLVADNALFFQGDVVGTFVADVRKAIGFNAGGESQTYSIDVTNSDHPLEITLAWHDYPAAVFAGLTPINDLNLRVTAPSGIVYAGNSFSGGQSSGQALDPLNNVERVRRDIPEVGTWTIDVLAGTINQPGQGYGLAASAILVPCDDCGGGDPPGNCVDPGHYGQGTPGTGGVTPTIAAIGWPYLGNSGWMMQANDFLGGATGALLLGFQQDNDSSAGWTRLVKIDVTSIILPVSYSPSGSFTLVLGIPNNPFIDGLQFFSQFIAFDPGAVTNVSATDGLASTICDPNG